MAQKFGNFRWVKDGYLDDRASGVVVGQITFAGLGVVDFCLAGDFTGEIRGRVIRFRNSKYVDDDRAIESLVQFGIPQIGRVSLISFDPHPLVEPHPYIEWFSQQDDHCRIELEPDDAEIVTDEDLRQIDRLSQSLQARLSPLLSLK